MARVLILHTGGTLGMRPREPDKALAPDEIGATMLDEVPELARIADVETRVLFNLDSSDIGPRHWTTIAAAIAQEMDDRDGFVITHGTDAMAYTACALSFLLRNLPKPVVLTGSQRPLANARSDGRANLVGAVEFATHGIPEVGIYFHDLLLRGNRATKSSTFAYDAFSSPNFPPLAQLGAGFRRIAEPIQPDGPFAVEGEFDTRVGCVRLVPGASGALWRATEQASLSGLVIEALGCGNVPVVDRSAAEHLSRLTDRGVVVAVASQARHGFVDLGRYVGGRVAREAGGVPIGDMTVEAAIVKLMYLLGTLGDAATVREALARPIAGEITPHGESPGRRVSERR
jgi:L-asparaginase